MKSKKILIAILSGILVILCAVALFLTLRQNRKFALANAGHMQGTYSWDEYQALSPEDQDAYFQLFDSVEAFEAWMNAVKPADDAELEFVWNKTGKDPDAYTWDEYQALDFKEQEAFYQWFDSQQTFEAWMKSAKPDETTEPDAKWDKPGKEPSAYTWEEYQALDFKEQEAFYQWFDSQQAFEAWMKSAKPDATTEPVAKWDKAGKKPNAYTWEEYQALSAIEQEAFYQWFGSPKAFEAWMKSVKPDETTESVAKWDKAGKKPSAYTWEEYQALSPMEQDAFFSWFASVEAFEAWMEKATDHG